MEEIYSIRCLGWKVDSLPTPETVNKRKMLLLCNQPLRYLPDTMASYLWRSKDIQLRDIWPTSSVIKTKKGKDPNIHIINGIHNIKGRMYVMFSSQIAPTNMSPLKRGTCRSSGTTYRGYATDLRKFWITYSSQYYHKTMMSEKVEPDIFKPPCHNLRKDIKTKLKKMLKEYQFQFAWDEITIGMTPLTKIMIDTRDPKPVSKIISNSDETLQMG